MFDQLKKLLPQQLQGSWERYASFYHRLEVPAKTILLHEGDVSKKAWYIEKGCLRVWFNNKGKDVTFQFFFEQEGVSSIESFRKGIPSLVTLETIEPCILYWIHKKDYENLMKELNEIPEFRNQLAGVMLDRQLNYMNHFMSFIKYTPKERYLTLLKEKPHIIKRIPQHYIASYLGITPVSLSRIRNAVTK
ncbi:cAMP-binding domain of CRP or a regulatory subunit of cAMP-dependent protein kinases [Mucilaginibacter sp. OK268]|uniref:Crp/Fnr family transcriptional regulator n=1 Tax=Mucilaginibacter sp. OK268 TaxID=1881048 RepID=UPI000887F53D|nr:Crp/Fnr family transcriptional regulator [Mucilaginibacter sp. OK268]SDP73980.1 cAMP-binding domain of CRP or a regulatory subunit of cAMP-dependent protein kinases [Mucilaginibacter sp. OK268]